MDPLNKLTFKAFTTSDSFNNASLELVLAVWRSMKYLSQDIAQFIFVR